MKVIIPVAGAGTRLRPHTYSIPKPLLHVAGRPVLAHILEPIIPLKPEQVVLVIGTSGKRIVEYVEDHYDVPTAFVTQEKLLGLGYALSLALETLNDDDEILIILGDTIVDGDFGGLLKAGDYVLGVKSVDDPKRFGIAEVADGQVIGLEEKPERPKSNLALAGVYYLREAGRLKAALAELIRAGTRTQGEIQLTDALHMMIEQGVRFTSYELDHWHDCGKRETLLATNQHLLKSLAPPAPVDDCVIIPPVFIAPTAQLKRSVIGPDVSISDGANVEDAVLSNSIIGYQASVRRSILRDSLVGHRAQVSGRVQMLNIGDSSEVADG